MEVNLSCLTQRFWKAKKQLWIPLPKRFQNATATVFVDYKGITVTQDNELRGKFREAEVDYAVVKNYADPFCSQ